MGLFTRPMRAHSIRSGGFHGCGACGGSGHSTCRTLGKPGQGWKTTTGKCQGCKGRGGRFQNHAPRSMRRLR